MSNKAVHQTKTNLIHTLSFYSFMILFNIFFPFTFGLSRWSLSFRFFELKICTHFTSSPHMLHSPPTSYALSWSLECVVGNVRNVGHKAPHYVIFSSFLFSHCVSKSLAYYTVLKHSTRVRLVNFSFLTFSFQARFPSWHINFMLGVLYYVLVFWVSWEVSTFQKHENFYSPLFLGAWSIKGTALTSVRVN
jgi:hypothetical protein